MTTSVIGTLGHLDQVLPSLFFGAVFFERRQFDNELAVGRQVEFEKPFPLG